MVNNNSTPRNLQEMLEQANCEQSTEYKSFTWSYNKEQGWVIPYFAHNTGLAAIPSKESIETLISGLKEFCKRVSQNDIDLFNSQSVQKFAEQNDDWEYAKAAYADLSEPIQLKAPSENPGFIYLLQAGSKFKIGKTTNIQKRIQYLQTGNAEKIVLLKTLYTQYPSQLEKELHGQYRQYRVGGEWFDLPDFVIEQICNMNS